MHFRSALSLGAITIALALGCQVDRTEKADPPQPEVQKPPVVQKPVVEEAKPGVDVAKRVDPVQDKVKAKPAAGKQDKKQDKKDPIDGHEFPPTIPDTPQHKDAWWEPSCLRCHETGVQGAPRVIHNNLPNILLTAKCRTCHVFVPGSKPRPKPKVKSEDFWEHAFPPMIPASKSHPRAWWKNDCLMCHEDGIRGAPKVVHKGMSHVLLQAKCRTCHVQTRAVDADRGTKKRH